MNTIIKLKREVFFFFFGEIVPTYGIRSFYHQTKTLIGGGDQIPKMREFIN